MRFLDGCAGIGGWALGLEMAGVRFDWHGFSEINRDAIAVYKAHWPGARNLGDLTRWREWEIAPGWLDVFSAGFPCPPFSVAGKRLGGDDPRNLWPAVADAIRGLRPRYVLLENVAGLLYGDARQSSYFGRVLGDLAEAGYDAEWEVLSAAEVGASHRRERVWVVAHADRTGRGEQRGAVASGQGHSATEYGGGDVGDSGQPSISRSGKLTQPESEQHPDSLASGDVGDAEDDGQSRSRGAWRRRAGLADTSLPLFPPAPDDAEGWRRVLVERPDLAPAVDGRLNPAFVEWLMGYPIIGWTAMVKRSARLRLLGNAIVPLCAAEALRRRTQAM